ncbi:TonB-linked SusC/RagA family outer membrane protein [Parabacteroides sp. PF5-6]|nr:TonB-linked SusC/RagA family outer membrane protein [Parabacteroides sp. PF5-6]
MRCILLFLMLGTLQSVASLLYSQSARLSLEMKDATVEQVLSAIEEESSFYFTYNLNQINVNRRVSVNVKDRAVMEILDELFASENIKYTIDDKHIILYKEGGRILPASQQGRRITGVVVDDLGEPIIGANVVEAGTTNGTITNFDGEFTLEQVNGNQLQVSYIGYTTRTISIGQSSSLRIVLAEDTQALDEVIVIGYGTQRKSDVSGSVTTVAGDKIANLAVSGAATALQGMAPGLAINFGNGAPGTSPTITVRGLTTWGSSNEPLVIIDGTPGDMSFLNPEDIKSMTVLKDAAMAAIYGSRSAAGVILIETHRGTAMKEPRIQISSFIGLEDLPKRMDICNSAEYIWVNKLALSNAGVPENRWPKYISAYEENPNQFADTDWQKEYYRRALSQKYNISYSAGNEIMNVALSGFYNKTDGIVEGTGSDGFGFRLNSDVKRGNFKMGESVSYGRNTYRPEPNTGFPGMFQTSNIEPLVSVYDENNEGGYGGAIPGMGMTDAANPVAFNNLIQQKRATDYISASAYVQYEPIKDLIFKFQASRNMNFYHSKTFVPTYYVGALKVNTLANLTEYRSKRTNDLMELTANYNKTFAEKHSLQAMLGLSQEESRWDDQEGYAQKFENNELPYLGHGQQSFAVDGEYNRNALRSAFGRVSYNYDYRYMAMFSARYDGSSRFGEGNKWGFFPSASLGWNIANEGFWENLKDNISVMKLRLSYGALGNQSIGNYMYIPKLAYNTNDLNYALGGSEINYGYAITGLPSYNIKWETTYYKNIGIDLGFWNNKLEVSLEGYIKDTKDMLSSKNISYCTGFGALTVNEGKLQTKGWELQTIYHGKAGDFRYDIDMNLSGYKSVLKEMSDPGYLYESGPARAYVGGEVGEFWVYETAGIFQSQQDVDTWNAQHGSTDANGNWVPLQPAAQPGDIRFIDQNGDGKLDSSDKYHLGSGNPKVIMGLNFNLAYKGFDLVANFYGNFGVKRYNGMKVQLQRMDKNFNYGKDALNSWRPDNTNTDIPRAVIGDPNGNIKVSDRFVENGDYLRLNNLQIGYNLPVNVCKQLKIENLRVYIGGNRLFTITGYKGYDAGTGDTRKNDDGTYNFQGYDYAQYPLSRSYTIGFKLGF